MITRIGSPNIGIKQDNLVHFHVIQTRPGMVEGVDYAVRVACNYGGYHKFVSDEFTEVTCPSCREKTEIKGRQNFGYWEIEKYPIGGSFHRFGYNDVVTDLQKMERPYRGATHTGKINGVSIAFGITCVEFKNEDVT
jgi:hypothetical protein